jgi:hypothetical protein
MAACTAAGSRDHPEMISVSAGGSDAEPEGKITPDSAPPGACIVRLSGDF